MLEEEEPGKKYIFIKDIALVVMDDNYEYLPDVSNKRVLQLCVCKVVSEGDNLHTAYRIVDVLNNLIKVGPL